MPVFERRYLSLKQECDHIYGVFRKSGVIYESFGGINPIYVVTAKSGGIFFKIPPFENRHPLYKVTGYTFNPESLNGC